jgi:phenylacetate-coenzyme A ligase PaaK-like adenylate-forming protein
MSARRAMSLHRRNARGSREELVARQHARFRQLVAHVAERSPYYARLIRERGIDPARARPTDFPVLTKELLMEHYDEIATDPRVRKKEIARFLANSRDHRELFAGAFRIVHGSGTSGQICYIAYRPSEWLRGASQFERVVRLGWRKRVAFVGAAGGHFTGVSLASPVDPVSAFFYDQRVFDINRPPGEIVAGLNAFRPRVLSGYATMIRELAERQRAGELRIRPQIVLFGGEAVSPADRRYVYRTFKCVVRRCYASTEHLYMAFDLGWPPGMYLLEDELIFEIEEDCTLVTNLFNRTVPLIRHRMDDVLAPPPPDAGSNGPYRIVGDVVGRKEHAAVFVNEAGERDSISPHVLGELYVEGLSKFQFRLTGDRSFRFVAQPEADAEPDEVARRARARLKELLSEKRMSNIAFEVEISSSVPMDPKTGKFRLVVQAD